MKKIAVLGSTGSIGLNSLKVIESNPGKYKAIALAAGRNIDLLTKQIGKFHPTSVAVVEESDADILRGRLKGDSATEVLSGIEGFKYLATLEEVDTVISAMAGAAGLLPTFAAINARKNIALANKETMVMAGPPIMNQAKKRGVSILPIDSELSAILQSLQGHPREDLRRVILTASGGPLRDLPIEKMEKVTPDQALRHPTWNMGQKISIDSATMMNKGLEVIEAKWFFDLRMDQIGILIHPQSIIHSMVEYRDGSVIAQLGIPDMITPITYALSYPRHIETRLPPLKLDEIGMLSFEDPDFKRFKCLDLAFKAAEIGESLPAVLNGANEIAVKFFLEGKINFLQIPILIEKTMKAHKIFSIENIENVMEADLWARNTAGDLMLGLNG
ncbi:MAG: 1-deoxy-D-xylulose-5-phosphate reductoisomerase [Desulfatiglandales bacterium]|jgi:1-deoxy-D-xylulose-5-phosphate reductoisomerase|nr:1-deoxy-D-xylulose-5-phosphate reductoisomerase [Desulfatiglandales bacterium]